jgi:hypothetical protein
MEHLQRECLMVDFRELVMMSGAALAIGCCVIAALVGIPL